MKSRFTFSIICCTLLALLTPDLLVAQTNEYGTTRKPLTCPSRTEPKTGAPSVEQAKKYFRCDYEVLWGVQGKKGSYLQLITDLNIKIAPVSRKFTPNDLAFNKKHGGIQLGMNPDKPVYDIRGSYTSYTCFNWPDKVGKNCDIYYFSDTTGICFLDTFGEWHCGMKGRLVKTERNVPPPAN